MMPQMLPIVPGIEAVHARYMRLDICIFVEIVICSRLTEDLVPVIFNNLPKVLNVRFGKVNTHNGQLGAVMAITVIARADATADVAAKLNSFIATDGGKRNPIRAPHELSLN